jgi:hypothetical protein
MRGATPDSRVLTREAKNMTFVTLAKSVKTSHQGVFLYSFFTSTEVFALPLLQVKDALFNTVKEMVTLGGGGGVCNTMHSGFPKLDEKRGAVSTQGTHIFVPHQTAR